jgi:hypothetical protein
MKYSKRAEQTKQRTGGKRKAEGQGEITKGLPKKKMKMQNNLFT